MKKQLKKIDKTEGRSTRVSSQNAKEALFEFFVWIENSVDSLNKLETTNASSELDRTELSKRDMEKLMRVKPKKFRKNSEGKDEPEEEDEEADFIPESNAAEEEDHLNNLNNDLLRTNDKFMKELKKKREALAKLKAEMSPKKKEEKVPEKPVAPPADE